MSATANFVTMPRALAERLLALTERVLAFSGDAPEADLIQLQHALAELLTPPSPTRIEHDYTP